MDRKCRPAYTLKLTVNARGFFITVALFALLGMALSGYLSYWNVFAETCSANPIPWLSCGSGTVTIFSLPTCVYGFFMFLAVLVADLVSLNAARTRSMIAATYYLGIVGVLFSGGLSVYELFVVKTPQLPACVYGLVFYLGILISAALWRRRVAAGSPHTPSSAETPQP